MEKVNGLTGEITTPILAQLEAMNDAIDFSSYYTKSQKLIIAQRLLEFKEKEVLEPKAEEHIQAEIHQGFGDVWFDDFHKMRIPLYMFHSMVYMWRCDLDLEEKFLGYRFTSDKFKQLYNFCNSISYIDLLSDLKAKNMRRRVDVEIREDYDKFAKSKEGIKMNRLMRDCNSEMPWSLKIADIYGKVIDEEDEL